MQEFLQYKCCLLTRSSWCPRWQSPIRALPSAMCQFFLLWASNTSSHPSCYSAKDHLHAVVTNAKIHNSQKKFPFNSFNSLHCLTGCKWSLYVISLVKFSTETTFWQKNHICYWTKWRDKSICFHYKKKKLGGWRGVFLLFKNNILELNIIVFRLKTKILWTKARTFQLRTS